MRLLIVVVAALGCRTPSSTFEPREVVADPSVTDADLYSASVRVLADRGYGFRDKDADAGLVTTEWVDVGHTLEDRTMHSWHVSIVEGELRLKIDCQVFSPSLNSRYDCSNDVRVDSWVRMSDEIVDEIQREATRRARKRRSADEEMPAKTAPYPDAGAAQ